MRSSVDTDDTGRQDTTKSRLIALETSAQDIGGDAHGYEARLQATFVAMHRLHDLQAMLASETNLETALGLVVSAAADFCETDRACIQVVSADGARLEMFVHHGYEPGSPFMEHFRHNGSEPACDASRANRARVIIEDVATLPALQGTEDRRVALAEGIRATQSTPMINRNGDLVGVLSVQFRKPHRSREDVLKLVDILAWTAAEFFTRHRMEMALRQTTEEKMRYREQELHIALKAGRFGAWSLDLKTRELTTSEYCRTNFGRPADQPFGYGELLAAVHPDDRQRMKDAVERSIITGEDYDIEYRIITPAGETRWVQIRGQAGYDVAGTPERMSGVSIDITGRRTAEAVLHDTSERLQLATDHAEIGFWDVDPINDQLIWPPRTKAMFGISADMPVSMRDFYAGLHPDDREATSAAYARAADPERRALYDVEYRTVGKEDGIIRWVAAKGRGLFDEQGHCVRVLGTAVDITSRKRAEEQARQDAQFLQQLLKSSADCIKVVGLDGRLEFMSAGGMVAMEVDDFAKLKGIHWLDLWKGLHEGEARQALTAAQNGRIGRFQGFAKTMAGNPRWWDVQVSPLVGQDGKPERLLAISRDVTATHAAEIELRRLNEKLADQVAARTADRDRIWRLTTDVMLVANLDGTIHAVNPAWTTSLGWAEEELIGQSLLDFIHPDDIAATIADMGRLRRGITSLKFKNRYRRKNGGYTLFTWTAVPADNLINAVGRDITAEREAEIEHQNTQTLLVQAQKMEAVGQLTGGLAHDFNNILMGISGAMELLKTKLGQGRMAEADHYVKIASDAAKRAASLTHRLLAFSRRQTLQPRAVDVSRLVAGMDDLIRRSIGPSIAFELIDAADIWPVLVDPPQLENSLLNLCINARDAMPDGGRITIEISNHCFDDATARERALAPGHYVSLCVTDTGTGIPPDIVARVFDPFFTTKPMGSGTGLGLSMIHGFAKQSGGQVRIDTEVGVGTKICLYLPRFLGEVEFDKIPAVDETRPGSGDGRVVLIVDDDASIRMLLSDALAEMGFRSIEAADGAAGLDVLRSNARIDLLITDVGLPGGMNGRQMADAGRLDRPQLGVLFITGYAESAAIGRNQLPQGMRVLAKPFSMEVLAARISELLDPTPCAT
jgi:PAS domain S-box-containing protein